MEVCKEWWDAGPRRTDVSVGRGCDDGPVVRQLYTVSDGRVVPPGRLVRMGEGNWEEPAPVRCPDGHLLRQGPVIVGWVPCVAPGRSGHRTHECRCGKVVYTPPKDEPRCRCEERGRALPDK